MKLCETHIRQANQRMNYLVYTPDRLIKEGWEIPAIVLIPQCHESFVWNNLTAELMALIDEIARRYRADPARLTVTGGSMGGFGTWDMGLCFPTKFAAIAPICGGGMCWRAANLRSTPVFAFHGACDDAVPVVYSQRMVDAVNRAGGQAAFTLFPQTGHNDAIHKAYSETDLLQRLTEVVRTDFTPVKEALSQHFAEDEQK